MRGCAYHRYTVLITSKTQGEGPLNRPTKFDQSPDSETEGIPNQILCNKFESEFKIAPSGQMDGPNLKIVNARIFALFEHP